MPMSNEIPPAQPNQANAAQGLSVKDKITLCVSIIALSISIASFVIGRLDSRAAKAKQTAELEVKQKSEAYKAYSLGQQVVRAFVFRFEVPKGEKNPKKLAQAQETGSFEISKLQQLSDLLDLRISDVRTLFTSPNPTAAGQVDPSQPFQEIDNRIQITHDGRTQAAYEVGYSSLLLYFRSKAYADRPDAAQSVIDAYPKLARGINRNLAALGMDKRVAESAPNLSKVTNEMTSLKIYLEDHWSH
jgi:hypothetical protein